jgi:flagellar hook-associated protein 2
MASTSSIGGLVSGLDTTSIVSSLMQLEAQPQTLLKNRLTTEQTTLSSLQGLNAKFAALNTKAAALATSTAWSTFTSNSSSSSVTAVAGSGATAGTLTFTVQQTSAAHQLSFATTAAKSDVVTDGSTHVTLTKHDGTTVDLDTGDGTLAGLVKAVNGSSSGVTANLLKLDDGTYRLKMASTTTGAASDFTLTNSDGSQLLGGATVTAGQDAKITVDGDTISSPTNTFTGLTTGLDVTLATGTTPGTSATVTVARNPAAAQASLQGLVDAANDLLSTIDTLTAYDATSQKSGALSGDATVRGLRSAVLDTVTRAADGSSMADVGVQTDRNGKVTFDTTKFASAYAADPTAVATKLGSPATATVPGFAARVAAMADRASNSANGVLTSTITGHQSSITTLQNGIADWDVRLAAKQESLNKQYADLEVSLGKLQDQASWLSGQIASLPGSTKSS